eukprot:Ihof_evm15s44 gene=Ihof_evmTU15s44
MITIVVSHLSPLLAHRTLAPVSIHPSLSYSPSSSSTTLSIPSTLLTLLREKRWVIGLVVFVLLVIGVPVWWHTTTVYRAVLPLSEMAAATAPQLVHPINVHLVIATDPSTPSCLVDIKALQRDLSRQLEEHQWGHAINNQTDHSQRSASQRFVKTVYHVTVENEAMATIGGNDWSVLDYDRLDNIIQEWTGLSNSPGHYTLMVLPSNHTTDRVPVMVKPYMGRYRTVLYKDVDCMNGQYTETFMASLVHTATVRLADVNVDKEEISHRVQSAFPPSGAYHISFTLLVADPWVAHADWAIADAINSTLTPMLSEMKSLANVTVDSQILYLAEVSQDLKRALIGKANNKGPGFFLTPDDLRMFVNPSDWNVATTKREPTLSFLLFIPDFKSTPMYIRPNDDKESISSAFILPRWGGVIILNPTYSSALNDTIPRHFTIDRPTLDYQLKLFASQLRTLIGIPNVAHSNSVLFAIDHSYSVCQWEKDVVLRYRVGEFLDRASSALASLARLLGDIESMVIQDHLQTSVLDALRFIKKAQSHTEAGELEAAHYAAQMAFDQSEIAFFHPSMLSLLYFPDEHKFAIYLPPFFPILVPVIIAVVKEIKRSMK